MGDTQYACDDLSDDKIDWQSIRAGDKEAIQYAFDCAEPLWKWILDHEIAGWRTNCWDRQDIEQDMRLRLLVAIPNFDYVNGYWASYVVGIARKHAAMLRSRRRWPGAETERKASWCDYKASSDSDHALYGMSVVAASLDVPLLTGEDDNHTVGSMLVDNEEWQRNVETRLDFLRVLEEASLTDCEYMVFVYHTIEDIPSAQCEHLLNLSHKQIDNALQRAKRKIRKAWQYNEDGCYTDAS